MLKIEFCDLEVQNAIYREACKYEGFIVKSWTNTKIPLKAEQKEFNYKEYYYEQIRINSEASYGLEKAISDYLLLQGEFLLTDDKDSELNGEYSDLIDDMECEVFSIVHWEDKLDGES